MNWVITSKDEMHKACNELTSRVVIFLSKSRQRNVITLLIVIWFQCLHLGN